MAQIPNNILNIVYKFIDELKNDNIKLSKVYLFGSYVKGDYNEDSDIDIAVISDDFQGSHFYDSKKIFNAVKKVSFDIETHPYKTDDFISDNPFVNEIITTGLEISVN